VKSWQRFVYHSDFNDQVYILNVAKIEEVGIFPTVQRNVVPVTPFYNKHKKKQAYVSDLSVVLEGGVYVIIPIADITEERALKASESLVAELWQAKSEAERKERRLAKGKEKFELTEAEDFTEAFWRNGSYIIVKTQPYRQKFAVVYPEKVVAYVREYLGWTDFLYDDENFHEFKRGERQYVVRATFYQSDGSNFTFTWYCGGGERPYYRLDLKLLNLIHKMSEEAFLRQHHLR